MQQTFIVYRSNFLQVMRIFDQLPCACVYIIPLLVPCVKPSVRGIFLGSLMYVYVIMHCIYTLKGSCSVIGEFIVHSSIASMCLSSCRSALG